MQARNFKVVVAPRPIIALVLRPPLLAPAMAVGSEAQNYWLRCERVARRSPMNFLLRNPGVNVCRLKYSSARKLIKLERDHPGCLKLRIDLPNFWSEKLPLADYGELDIHLITCLQKQKAGHYHLEIL